MQNHTIRDLANACTNAELYVELCLECGTDAITEEDAILNAIPIPDRAWLAGSDYWLFLADQTVTMQEEISNELYSRGDE